MISKYQITQMFTDSAANPTPRGAAVSSLTPAPLMAYNFATRLTTLARRLIR